MSNTRYHSIGQTSEREKLQSVAYRWGRRGDSSRAALWGGRQKRKKRKKEEEKEKKGKKKKGKKREKENMGEAKTEFEHLSWGAPMHVYLRYNLTFWRPYPFWRGSAVRLYVLLHMVPKCIGALYILHGAPTTLKHVLTLVTLTYRFGAPLHFGAPMHQKHV